MPVGTTVEAATSVQAVLAMALTALCGVLVYVFKVWMPKILQDARDDMQKVLKDGREDNRAMIGHLLKEAETNRQFVSTEMAKRDAVLERVAVRVSELSERIELCPQHRGNHA
jgi:predicted aminopeptidase